MEWEARNEEALDDECGQPRHEADTERLRRDAESDDARADTDRPHDGDVAQAVDRGEEHDRADDEPEEHRARGKVGAPELREDVGEPRSGGDQVGDPGRPDLRRRCAGS